MTDDRTATRRQPMSNLRYRLAVTVAVAVAIAALVAGYRATVTEDKAPVTINGRPDVVEHLQPRHGAEALRQAEIGIDLAPGYDGALLLNGTAIPDEELRRVPEQNQVFFAPGPGRSFEALPSGQNCVTAVVWHAANGRGTADLTFEWCFDVT